MSQSTLVRHTVFAGPSLLAPHAVVEVEFALPVRDPIAATKLEEGLGLLLPAALLQRMDFSKVPLTFEAATASIVRTLSNLAGTGDLTVSAERLDNGNARLLCGYLDPEVTRQICDFTLKLVYTALGPAAQAQAQNVQHALRQLDMAIQARHPDYKTAALFRAAKRRGIPVYCLVGGSRMWRFGQGSVGLTTFETAVHHDSAIGARLVRDKFLANHFIRRLGLPSAVNGVVTDLNSAKQVVQDLGYPLVVKPHDSRKGIGVTANITADAEFERAFGIALQESEGRVLVERFVPGHDYRISVVGGKVEWVVRRTPPTVIGDDRHSVAELIDAENKSREEINAGGSFFNLLEVDDDMQAVLAKQGLTLDDIPQQNRAVRLRTIANTSTGGLITDCTDELHPDNRAMAEALARALYLDAIGIDFISPDISVSWRDSVSAVVDINTSPGFSSDARAEQLIGIRFPAPASGRIPTVMLVDAPPAATAAASAALSAAGATVATVEPGRTTLGAMERGTDTDSLAERVTSMLLDPGCDGLVIAANAGSLEQSGMPLDYVDLLITGSEIAPATATFLGACSGELLPLAGTGPVAVEAAVNALTNRVRAGTGV